MDSDLSALWAKKKTGSEIAAILSEKYGRVFSRSGIMGRINRLNLQRKNGNDAVPNAAIHKKPSKNVRSANVLRVVREVTARGRKTRVTPQITGLMGGLPMIDSSKGCTYIYGDARERDFCPNRAVFNRRSTSGAVSWCAEHAAIVYQPEKALSKSRVASLSIPSQRGRQVAR